MSEIETKTHHRHSFYEEMADAFRRWNRRLMEIVGGTVAPAEGGTDARLPA